MKSKIDNYTYLFRVLSDNSERVIGIPQEESNQKVI
jgi:hypothetical protein